MAQNSNLVIPSAAAAILKKAVDCDNEKKYSQALLYYQEGIQFLLDAMKESQIDGEARKLRSRIEDYMTRAEILKKQIAFEKNRIIAIKNDESTRTPNLQHFQITIENNSTGHSYATVFGKYLNENVTEIEVDDPYIRLFHQCQNFLRFCELAVRSCENLRRLSLTTCEDKTEQKKWLENLQQDLSSRFRIQLDIIYSTTLHDREIRLDNGWVIKIGRGLDYFKGVDHKFMIGCHDQDLRKCHETTVDIFHREFVKKSYG